MMVHSVIIGHEKTASFLKFYGWAYVAINPFYPSIQDIIVAQCPTYRTAYIYPSVLFIGQSIFILIRISKL